MVKHWTTANYYKIGYKFKLPEAADFEIITFANWHFCKSLMTGFVSTQCCLTDLFVSHVFLIDPPEITFYQSSYTVNETSNVSMVCRAKGVPQPTIIWTRSGSSKELAYGEQFLIVNTKGSDDGTYLCIARNDVGQQDSIDVTLNVQSKYAVKVDTLTFFPSTSGPSCSKAD